MSEKTLFLAWQDPAHAREWFPVGRLDVEVPRRLYRFRYVRGAERAHEQSGFEPLFDFPDFHASYEAHDLFPLFQNRVLGPHRRDFPDYLCQLDLPDRADPIEILAAGGGQRATDSFEVFPKIERRDDGSFRCRFFLRGSTYLNAESQGRIVSLGLGEPLYVALVLANPAFGLALQIQTQDYYMIGWAPRYLMNDLKSGMDLGFRGYNARVVRVNPALAPSKQRVLVEFCGRWSDHERMTTADFEPLGGQ